MSGRRLPTAQSAIAQRLAELDVMLCTHGELWRPQPYKTMQPAWCATHPSLARALPGLGDAQVDALTADPQALIAFMASVLPQLAGLAPSIEIEPCKRHPLKRTSARWATDVPGRKAAQVEAFAQALGVPRAAVTEWCAGKGHLGRRLAVDHAVAVESLDADARLCEVGLALARRAGAENQRFVTVDVLSPFGRGRLRGRHAVALHACGELHVALMRNAAADGAVALHLAPCCYHKTADRAPASLSGESSLELNRDDLRLAVSDTVAARPKEVQAGRLEAAWILGFRAMAGGERLSMRIPGLRHVVRPRRAGFRAFCERAAAMSGVALDAGIDWPLAEGEAIALEQRVRRLSLPRLAFRRAIELWLAFDRARYLEQRGYRVSVSTFCPRAVTPRNLLICAQR